MAQVEEFVGIAVSKLTLDVVILPDRECFKVDNDDAGWAELIKRLAGRKLGAVGVEASGGYERGLLGALLDAGLPARRLNPYRVRCFAQGIGILAKNDKIDAEVIARFVQMVQQRVVERDEAVETLAELVTVRRQLSEECTRATNQADHASHPLVKKLASQRADQLRAHIKQLDEAIKQAATANEELTRKNELVRTVPGVGQVFTSGLLGLMPELGSMTNRQAAALLGVAPFDFESGRFRGQRHIFGGRRKLRDIAYMAALSATRFNPVFKAFYERLRDKGKAAKVAIVAVMRKMIVTLNAMVRNNQPWAPA